MAATLAAQRAAFAAELPVSLERRRDRLERAAAMIADHADRFCDALSEDFGHRSRDQSMIADIAGSVAPLRHAIRHLKAWAKPERRRVPLPLRLLGARAWVEYQPKGVVGVIAPWNFPVSLVMAPLAGVLAAGNRAMIKGSEYTPATAALFEELVPRSFDADELAFVSGGPEAGQAFAALPFDHLLFTGATGIARHILHAAADHLTPVTLELGGKSPVVIGARADLASAAERIVVGKMLNAGQVCLAPDYVLVPGGEEPRLAAAIKAAATALYPTVIDNDDCTAIINDRHHRRLNDWLRDAHAKGATVEVINPAGEDPAASNTRKLPLHLVRDVTDDMLVMQEEIFGSILPIRRYGEIDEAVELIASRGRPLALYYFGPDEDERRRLIDRTVSGAVAIDDVVFQVGIEDLPFGGIGPSGMGAYHGVDGFRTFSHARACFRQSRRDVARLAGLKPPYGAATRRSIARQIKG